MQSSDHLVPGTSTGDVSLDDDAVSVSSSPIMSGSTDKEEDHIEPSQSSDITTHQLDQWIKTFLSTDTTAPKSEAVTPKLSKITNEQIRLAVENCEWAELLTLMENEGVSDQDKWSAIYQSCDQCKDVITIVSLLRHCPDDSTKENLCPRVARDQLLSVLGSILEKECLQSDLLFCVSRWADKLTTSDPELDNEQSTRNRLFYIVTRFSSSQQQEILIYRLLDTDFWELAVWVLNNTNEDVRLSVLHECIKINDTQHFESYLLPMYRSEELDQFVNRLISEGEWDLVEKLIRLVGKKKLLWTVGEISLDTDTLLDVATCTCRRKETFPYILRSDITDDERKQALGEDRESADIEAETWIQSGRVVDNWDQILSTIVTCGLWEAVSSAIEHKATTDEQRKWLIQQTCIRAESALDIADILHHCSEDLLNFAVEVFTERHMWEAINSVFLEAKIRSRESSQTSITDSGRWKAVKVALEEADEKNIGKYVIGHLCHYDKSECTYVLQRLICRELWNGAAGFVCGLVNTTLDAWIALETETEVCDEPFWDIAKNVSVDKKYTFDLILPLRKRILHHQNKPKLKETLTWDTLLSEIMWICALDASLDIIIRDHATEVIPEDLIYEAIKIASEVFNTEISFNYYLTMAKMSASNFPNVSDKAFPIIRRLQCKFNRCGQGDSLGISSPTFVLQFVKAIVRYCLGLLKVCFLEDFSETVLIILTTVPIVPYVQNTVLGAMLRQDEISWEVLRLASLSHAWEHVRRDLFQTAVEQKQWYIVKQWVDHALYDDQRLWALEEAYKHHQWDVMVVLADHGLNEAEQLRVYNRLYRHADWDVLQQLFDRGVNMLEMKELLLRETLRSKEAKNQDGIEAKNQDRINRLTQWTLHYRKLQERARLLRTFEAAVAQADWRVILYSIHKNPDPQHIQLALKEGIVHKAWPMVRHLVRHEMDQARRDAMFVLMVRRRQWGVCRTLLETGISKDQCVSVLTQLMDLGQWTLVAFVVLHHDAGDRLRWDILERAMATRQGTVVWLCIKTMQQRLSESQREDLFQKALLWEIWQAVNPLIEMKDDMGRRHRDQTLLAAIQKQQWDIVDHCQLQHADINVKDSDGNTPIHRAAQDMNWPSVNALAERGGDPSLLDSRGLSALHRAGAHSQINTFKLLIQYQGDVHQPAKHTELDVDDFIDEEETRAPLQIMIDLWFRVHDKDYTELFDELILWCPDLGRTVSKYGGGRTVFQQACCTDAADTLYYFMTRGVNPLAVTETGQSAIPFALMSHASQKMLVACIRLGLSTYQPLITDTVLNIWWKSPVVLALARGCRLAVAQMLYESGACSHRELFILKRNLSPLVDSDCEHKLKLWEKLLDRVKYEGPSSDIDTRVEPTLSIRQQKFVEYLLSVASQPRTLKSSCRLVISHCISVDKHRHGDIACLPVLSEDMKNYVMFQDLTDPDFGKDNSDHAEQDSYVFDYAQSKAAQILGIYGPTMTDEDWAEMW